jgi:DNA invertase Pin-like site-specific DNA recombinase
LKDHPEIEAVSEKVDDDGYSGIPFDRPAFQEMIDDIKEGKINCVIVKDISRFGREYIATGTYLRKVFPALGVRFIAINDDIDTEKENLNDDLSFSIKSLMNDSYCRDISTKTRSALSAKRKNGKFVGAFAVYGYVKSPDNKNQLIVDEYAAGIVQDIFRMKLEGMSALKISEELNLMGILSPLEYKKSLGLPHSKGGYGYKSNVQWSATTIIRALKDEIYTGTLVQGKQGTPNYKIKVSVTKPVKEWIRIENAHEAIIRRNDFDLVQRIMRLDTRTSPSQSEVYIFSGILICGCCGNRMTRKIVTQKGQQYFYYYCKTGKKNGCAAPMVRESELIDCVLESVKAHIRNVASLEVLLDSVGETALSKKLADKIAVRIVESERNLEKIKGFQSNLYEKFLRGFLEKEDFGKFKAQYADEVNTLETAILAAKHDLAEVQENRNEKLRWIEHFRRFENISTLDRKTVISLIESIHVFGKNEIQISFNYQSEYEKASFNVERQLAKEAV